MSSSQLTNSYFSEGLKPPTRFSSSKNRKTDVNKNKRHPVWENSLVNGGFSTGILDYIPEGNLRFVTNSEGDMLRYGHWGVSENGVYLKLATDCGDNDDD
jgi:hypothetical protein